MMRLPIGATIRVRDGIAGKLKFVVVDPAEGVVTDLIVEKGKLLHHDIVVPTGWVEGESNSEVLLNATAEDLNTLPEYKEVNFSMPDPSYRPLSGHRVEETRFWFDPYNLAGAGKPRITRRVRLGIQEDEVVLQRSLPVKTQDDHNVGKVDHLVIDQNSRQVTHFVVRRGSILDPKAYIVPIDRVTSVSEFGVQLNMTPEEFEHLPLYQTPATDWQIAVALQRTLNTDPRTRSSGLLVNVLGGVVRFVGSTTEAVMGAAKSIARRMRGVIGFEDEAVAPPFPPLRSGEPVYARDGRYGTLGKVVIDPYARRVTHLVVRKGWLLTEDHVIPFEKIEHAELDGIYLNLESEELEHCPRYQEEAFVEPLEGWKSLEPYGIADSLFWGGPYTGLAPTIQPLLEYTVHTGIPEDEIMLQRGTDIFLNDEVIGSLDHLLFDPTSGTVTHLVVHENRNSRNIIITAGWVSQLDAESICLNRWEPLQPGVLNIDTAHHDAEITALLSSNLNTSPRYQEVQVLVEHHWIFLSGYVPTIADKLAVETISRNIPGVVHVSNAVITDTELAGQIVTNLTADPQTAPYPIEVIADRGVVRLKGAVQSPEIKAMAEAIARRNPRVRTVINELEIRTEEIYE